MQEIIIKPKTIIRFRIGDQTYDVRRPTLGEAAELEERLIEAKPRGAKVVTDTMCGFLASLGLPKEISVEFEDEQLEQVIEALKPKKKS